MADRFQWGSVFAQSGQTGSSVCRDGRIVSKRSGGACCIMPNDASRENDFLLTGHRDRRSERHEIRRTFTTRLWLWNLLIREDSPNPSLPRSVVDRRQRHRQRPHAMRDSRLWRESRGCERLTREQAANSLEKCRSSACPPRGLPSGRPPAARSSLGGTLPHLPKRFPHGTNASNHHHPSEGSAMGFHPTVSRGRRRPGNSLSVAHSPGTRLQHR